MQEGLTVAEAQRLILDAAAPLGAETVPAADAQGRVLVEPVVSTRTLPPEDNSAMDGYAVRAADVAAAPVSLPVVYEVPAGGHAPRALAPGEAARILTGAPIPVGADAVVRQEDTTRAGDHVRIEVGVAAGESVRRAGEDVACGETVLDAGQRLAPGHLGMLASLGRTQVPVHRRPTVALLSGGDELVEPDGDVSGGRIVSSNSYTLAAQCREVGALPSYLGIARDEPADIERRHAPAPLLAEVAIAPFRDSDGRPDGVVLEIRDRSIHQELLDAESQRHRIRSFGRIAAGIAHEVKNPLGGIRGAGELVAKRSDDPRMKKAAELVIRESDRISTLLDDFMVLGQEEGIRPREVNLHRILDDVIDLNDLDPLSDGVTIRRVYDPSIPEILADRDRLAQVFHNLVRNALQCMAEREDPAAERLLEIRSRVDLDHPLSVGDGPRVPSVSIEVCDSGPGIPDAVRDKVTVPFFTTRATGTGLGLAIAQHWVTAHRGRLVLESAPERGTRARVTLPLRTARSSR